MSVLPDYILQTLIVRGIRALRNDSRLIDQLFRNLDQKSLADLRKFVKEQPIDLSMNYPRTVLKVPAIVILLKSEREAQAFLSDSEGIETPDIFAYDDETSDDVLGGAASASAIAGNTKLVYGPGVALTGTENTLRVADKRAWNADQFVGQNLTLRITGGTGKGQIRNIVANGQNVIMIDGAWVTIPDKTSTFEVVAPPGEMVGQPSTLYNRQDKTNFIERRGVIYSTAYQIQIIGPSPEFTICLTTIIKAIFILGRQFLERQGVINHKISASDFVPRAEYQPDLTYMRALTVEFIYPFDVYESMDSISTIDLKLEYDAWPIAEEPVVSDTSFTIDEQGDVVDNLSDVNRVYWGVATPPGSFDANFVQNVIGIQGTAIASKRQRVIILTTGVGQKMYYIIPARFGGSDMVFIDALTNVEAGFVIAATVSVTTTFETENYNIWESENSGLSTVTLQIL